MRKDWFAVLLTVVAAAVVALAEEAVQRPPAASDVLTRTVSNLSSSPEPGDVAFQVAMLGAGVPGGEARVEGCAEVPKKSIRILGPTLREVLDSITTADPRYRWEVHEGVVNLAPAGGLPALLRVRIDVFDSKDAASTQTAEAYLFGLPEVRKGAAKLGLTQVFAGGALYSVPPGHSPPEKPLSVLLKNVTIQGALNALVRLNKRGVWIYRERRCGTPNTFDFHFTE